MAWLHSLERVRRQCEVRSDPAARISNHPLASNQRGYIYPDVARRRWGPATLMQTMSERPFTFPNLLAAFDFQDIVSVDSIHRLQVRWSVIA
jgi:hypothetical protein